MNSVWKRKLAANSHDPPEKTFDFGPAHQAAARNHAASFGVAELWDALSHNPDWSAAAADRFVFPNGSKKGVGGLGEEEKPVFVHPISGRTDGQASWKSKDFPTAEHATQWQGDIRPDWKDNDPQTLFLKAWRLWMGHAASHASGQGRGAENLPYLPADTRVPDASIWHHCAVVSAIEGTRREGDEKAPIHPAFLLFQVGPVQEFIAQDRSTRDLRNGPYLLSWLMMHAIKAVADECGPDALIFPSLRGQPIYEWLQKRSGLKPDPRAALTPGIANRFLALVPQDFEAPRVEAAFRKEWQGIARGCAASLRPKGLDLESRALRREQLDQHWQINVFCPRRVRSRPGETDGRTPKGSRSTARVAEIGNPGADAAAGALPANAVW
jgi:CRISPR-associated protein Cmr2